MMDKYSEATREVFTRSINLLEGKLPKEKIDALKKLLDAGELTDLSKLEKILRETGS